MFASRLCRAGWIVLLCGLAGCAAKGDPARPIPTAVVASGQHAQRLVVVLPGRADDLGRLQRSGIVQAVQAAWRDADVLLAELTLDYYLDGGAPRRLHREVIVPARQRGYREIWLVGASLGGTGALLYDASYPGSVEGMVLLAPYLGERRLLMEIAGAGGIARWNPGPPQSVTAQNWQREMWRHLQGWAREPARARNVWLAYGERDRLRSAMSTLTPLLRPNHILVRPGGHAWRVWSPALREVLLAAGTAPASGASAP